MRFWVIVACMVFVVMATAQTAKEAPHHEAVSEPPTTNLAEVRRIYVEALAGDNSAEAIRQFLIVSLQQSHLFVITDNPNRADVTLKGAANDSIFTDTFDRQESLNARSNSGTYSGRATGSLRTAGGYSGLGVGQNESEHSRERKHEAYVSVRLCNRDGDVLWATTQESKGAKFRGASADVADKVMRQLQIDFNKAVHAPAGAATANKDRPATTATPE
jgi:hypothetical protein